MRHSCGVCELRTAIFFARQALHATVTQARLCIIWLFGTAFCGAGGGSEGFGNGSNGRSLRDIVQII